MLDELARAVWGSLAARLRRPIYWIYLGIAVGLWATGHFVIGDWSLEGLQRANRQLSESLLALSPVGIYMELQAAREAAETQAFRRAVEAVRHGVNCDPMSNPDALINPACWSAGAEPSIIDQLLAPFRAIYRSVTDTFATLYGIVSAGGPLTVGMFVLTHAIAFLALSAGAGIVAAIFLTPVVATLLALALKLLLLLLTFVFGAVLAVLMWGATLFGFALWLIKMLRQADEIEASHGVLGAFAARSRKRRIKATGT